MLKGLKDAGIDLPRADLVVGTSGGATLSTQLRGGRPLDGLYNASVAPPSAPASAASQPAYDKAYEKEVDQPVISATEITQALRLDTARRALAATQVISEDAQIKATAAALGDIHDWPQQPLKLSAIDATDGSVRLFDKTQAVPIERTLAAATAKPGQVAPITIGDRRYTDGTVNGTNVDAAAGYGTIVALVPPALVRPECPVSRSKPCDRRAPKSSNWSRMRTPWR